MAAETYNHIYGAGLKHGQIKTAEGTVLDIDAIINFEADPESEATEIPGDDGIKAVFNSSRKESLTLTANAISADVLEAITGVQKTLTTTTGWTIPLGTDAENSAPFVELTGVINAKTEDGTNVLVKRTYHKVQVTKYKVNSSNGSEMSVEMEATAVKTDKDITGQALTPARVGTLAVEKGTM